MFSRYYTIAFGGQTTLQLEDRLFEYAEHDFLKPQDTTPDSVIRRCTFAHSTVTGTDGIDTGANAQLTVDNCLFYDIPDKAISIEASTITIANSLIYDCGIGVAVKDDSDVILNSNTIVNSTYGIGVYLKNAGALFAHAAATNNIVWETAPTLLSGIRTQAPLRRLPPLVSGLAMSAAVQTILEPETSTAIQGLSTLRPEISAWQLAHRPWAQAPEVLTWAHPILRA